MAPPFSDSSLFLAAVHGTAGHAEQSAGFSCSTEGLMPHMAPLPMHFARQIFPAVSPQRMPAFARSPCLPAETSHLPSSWTGSDIWMSFCPKAQGALRRPAFSGESRLTALIWSSAQSAAPALKKRYRGCMLKCLVQGSSYLRTTEIRSWIWSPLSISSTTAIA